MASSARAPLSGAVGARSGSERRARGFTLIELMVVVVIISVLAVIAVPAISTRMRDRRVQAAAQEVSTIFRNARLRALGRGSAVLVRYTTADARGLLTVREAVRGTVGTPAACSTLPDPTCLGTWETTNSQAVTTFGASVSGTFSNIRIDMFNPARAAVTTMDVCFTPLGRTFVRYDAGAFTPLTGVPSASIWRDSGGGVAAGLKRTVLIPPNGAARIGLAQ